MTTGSVVNETFPAAAPLFALFAPWACDAPACVAW